MMLLWITLSALAAEPYAVERVATFTLEQPETWRYQQQEEALSEGVLLQVRLPPETLEARAIGVPLVLLGARALERLSWDDQTGCAVLWGPSTDLTRTPLWLGPDLLPERLDPERTAALELQARTQPHFDAAQLRSAQQAGGGARTVTDKSAVLGVAADWLEACAPSQQQQVEALRSAAAPKHW